MADPHTPSTSARLYDHQHDLYALAFSYRDVPAQVDALAKWARLFGPAPQRVLELAAGPADHAIEFARRGVPAVALDLSPGMCRRAAVAAEQAGVELETVCANMIDFQLRRPVDLAFTLINSLSHLHTLDQLVQHFAAVSQAVVEGGLYIVELAHPMDFVGRSDRSTGVGAPWTVEAGETRLTTQWGRPNDRYDPVRQLFFATVEFVVERGSEREWVEHTVVMRDWTLDELGAAARLAGGHLSLQARFGGFDGESIDDPDAWRAILVFGRRGVV